VPNESEIATALLGLRALAKDFNALEPRPTWQGYNAKVLAELLNAKPHEIKSFLSGQLASGRTQ
jgi:hypothetical protein